MRKHYRFAVITSLLILLHLFTLVTAAFAHPLGNFTINHYAGLHLNRREISIEYILDMAEIPAFQEIAGLDANGNGEPEKAETAGYETARCAALGQELTLSLDGRSAPLELLTAALEFPPGVGGLLTLRLTCGFRAGLAATDETIEVDFQNNAYAERLGWREIVITGEDVHLQGVLPEMGKSLSQRLTVYPEDLLSIPLNQVEASFGLSLAEASQSNTRPPADAVEPPDGNFNFAALIRPFRLPLLITGTAAALAWSMHYHRTKRQGRASDRWN